MAVRIFYIDESYDAGAFCLSALSIRHTDWKECFDLIREHRLKLKADYGIPLYKEMHARDLVRGRGQLCKTKAIGKWERSQIFVGLLHLITRLPTVLLFNVCLPQAGFSDAQIAAWDRMMNRIERTMKAFEQLEHGKRRKLLKTIGDAKANDPAVLSDAEMTSLDFRLNLFRARAMIIADEGREAEITRAVRKMHVYNPVPSQYREWSAGVVAKNIPTDRIIEDPTFKRSARSYFLQLTDCIAFALLKMEVPPTPSIATYGIDKMFPVLRPACYLKASPRDPFGIVRK